MLLFLVVSYCCSLLSSLFVVRVLFAIVCVIVGWLLVLCGLDVCCCWSLVVVVLAFVGLVCYLLFDV